MLDPSGAVQLDLFSESAGFEIVAMLTFCWVCVRSCIRRADVVAYNDGSQKRGVALLSVVVGWYDELGTGTVTRVSYTGEEVGHERLLLWPSGRISEQDGARCCWWELTEVRNAPWLLAEPLVDLEIGNLPGPDEASEEVGSCPRQWSVSFWTRSG